MEVKNIILSSDEKETLQDFTMLILDICVRANGVGNCIGEDCPYINICSGFFDDSINNFCNTLSENFKVTITTER